MYDLPTSSPPWQLNMTTQHGARYDHPHRQRLGPPRTSLSSKPSKSGSCNTSRSTRWEWHGHGRLRLKQRFMVDSPGEYLINSNHGFIVVQGASFLAVHIRSIDALMIGYSEIRLHMTPTSCRDRKCWTELVWFDSFRWLVKEWQRQWTELHRLWSWVCSPKLWTSETNDLGTPNRPSAVFIKWHLLGVNLYRASFCQTFPAQPGSVSDFTSHQGDPVESPGLCQLYPSFTVDFLSPGNPCDLSPRPKRWVVTTKKPNSVLVLSHENVDHTFKLGIFTYPLNRNTQTS